MILSWYGQSCFKLQTRYQENEVVLIIDPFSKEIGLRPPQLKTDIVLVSHNHQDHNNVNSLGGEPFVISGPGEYEIKGIEILGIPAFHDTKEGKERGQVTIFIFKIEGIKVVHLGDLGQSELSSEQLDRIGEVDILMIPVGGKFTISGEEAVKIINQIEPRMVIPMHYKIPGLKTALDAVDGFLKAMGISKKEAVDKLSVKRKDLPQEGTEVVVMKVG